MRNKLGTEPAAPSSIAIEERWATVDRYRMRYLCGGTGPALVLDCTASLSVLPGRSERKLAGLTRQIQAGDVLFTGIALLIACLTGLLYLYVGKTFGSLSDYLLAVLWGFGIDNSGGCVFSR